MHWKKIVKKDSPFLGEWDVDGKTPLELTIESAQEEVAQSERGEEKVLTVKFKGANKRMILNNTNATILERLTGEGQIEKWAGKKVKLRRAEIYNRMEKCKDICLRFDATGMTLPKKFPKFTYVDHIRSPQNETTPEAQPEVEGGEA
jgi:hypothetical protein